MRVLHLSVKRLLIVGSVVLVLVPASASGAHDATHRHDRRAVEGSSADSALPICDLNYDTAFTEPLHFLSPPTGDCRYDPTKVTHDPPGLNPPAPIP